MINDDMRLLRDYAERQSEAAFETLVARYAALVYSAAMRQVGDSHLANEITQTVFILLARKAESLSPKTILPGWLYRTTRHVSSAALKMEYRRRIREQEAMNQESTADLDWEKLAPLLDDAMSKLREPDRDAIVLRYFQNKNLRDIGAALGVDEYAAQKRVARALEKLHAIITRHDITSTASAIAETISAHSVALVPAASIKAITTIALSKGAAGSTSTLTLVKGALKIMAWTKAETAIVAGAVALLTAGTTTVAVKEYQEHRTYPWQVDKGGIGVFYAADAQITIVPTKFPQGSVRAGGGDSNTGAYGIAKPVKTLIRFAFQQDNELRTVYDTELPTNRYDFMAKLVGPDQPHKQRPINTNWTVEFQKAIARKFGVTGHFEKRNADVLALVPGKDGVKNFNPPHADPKGGYTAVRPILKPSPDGVKAGYEYHRQPVSTLTINFENKLGKPIVDMTGLNVEGGYDYSLLWDQPTGSDGITVPPLDKLNPLLLDQLGLELVPTNMPISMLVVTKVK